MGKPKAPWWEPGWGRASEAIAAARDLGVQNAANISAALGCTPSPANDLRVVRNFFAHRGEKTSNEVRAIALRLGIQGYQRPDDLVKSVSIGTTTLVESWVQEMDVIAEAAIQ